MISPELDKTILEATKFASRNGRLHTSLVDILLALVDRSDITSMLRSYGVNHIDVRETLYDYYEINADKAQTSGKTRTPAYSKLGYLAYLNAMGMDEFVSPRQFVIQVANLVHNGEEDSIAIDLLAPLSERKFPKLQSVFSSLQDEDDCSEECGCENENKALTDFCTNLSELAARSELDNVYGREAEITRLMEILGRKKKANPILLGEPGVGKTSVVEGLAVKIQKGAVGRNLKDVKIYSLNVADIIAGTQNRGDLELRIKDLLAAFSENRDRILFVDEAHVLLGGASAFNDVANLIKPALTSSKIRCIGATTHGEYYRYFSSDPAMSRRFQSIDVHEPSTDDAKHLLSNVAGDLSAYHGVSFEDGASDLAVDLTSKLIVDRFLPDKAIDVLDEAGSIAAARDLELVDSDLIKEVVSRMIGVTVREGSSEENLSENLIATVKGHDDACRKIARAVKRSECSLKAANQAKLSMAFIGPDGVGKKHLAETLAAIRNTPLVSFNMTAFRDAASVSRLIGSPPGYVGYGQGGQFTEAVRRNPSCIVLIDNIDDAHPDVAALIHEAKNTGRLTDATGKTISLAGVTFIFLCKQQESRQFGFHHNEGSEHIVDARIRSMVDIVVSFDALDRSALSDIANSQLKKLKDEVSSMGNDMAIDTSVANYLVDMAVQDGGSASAVTNACRNLIEDRVFDATPEQGEMICISAIGQGLELQIHGRTTGSA